ncbi:unnamed protein product, partial [Prorocentrum cordatum]
QAVPNYISVAHRPSVREYHTHVTVMTMNPPELDAALAVARFSTREDCEFGEVDSHAHSQMEGNREEQVWAMKRLVLETGGEQGGAAGEPPAESGAQVKESGGAPHGEMPRAPGGGGPPKEAPRPLPDLSRSEGPLSLFVRA